jgi:hypothetical protein
MISFCEGSAYIGKFMNPSITVPFNSLNLCSTRSTLAQPLLNPLNSPVENRSHSFHSDLAKQASSVRLVDSCALLPVLNNSSPTH